MSITTPSTLTGEPGRANGVGEQPNPAVPTPLDALTAALGEIVLAVPGVYTLGNPVTRMLGVARAAVTGQATAAGISLVQNPPRLTVRVSLVTEYPANVTEVAGTVRSALAHELAPHHPGPIDVDVTVTDVHGPFDVALEVEVPAEVDAEVDPEPALATAPPAEPVLVQSPAPGPVQVIVPAPDPEPQFER